MRGLLMTQAAIGLFMAGCLVGQAMCERVDLAAERHRADYYQKAYWQSLAREADACEHPEKWTIVP